MEQIDNNLEAEGVNAHALAPVAPMSMSDIMSLGSVLVRSGMFRSTTNAEQAVAKILAGREYGLGPVTSMTHIYVIDGKVGMSASLIGAKIRQHPAYNFQVVNHDDAQCSIEFYYQDKPAGVSDFTMQHAKDAGLIRRGGAWEKYPRNMVYARALTNGARWYCPDVFGGAIYTPEELGARVVFDAVGAEVVESLPTAAPLAAAPAQEPQEGAVMLVQAERKANQRGMVTLLFEPLVLNVTSAERGQLQSGSEFEAYTFKETLQYTDANGLLQTAKPEWRASFEAYERFLQNHADFESGAFTRGEFRLALRQGRGDSWWQNIEEPRTLPNEIASAEEATDWPEMPEEGA